MIPPPSTNIKAVPAGNSISIQAGKIFIVDPQKPVLILHYIIVALIGLTGFLNGYYFAENNKSYHLILLIASVVFLSVFLARELIFRTYENEIKLLKVSKISIRKIPGGKENVNLVIHLKQRKRIIFISEARAREARTILNNLHY